MGSPMRFQNSSRFHWTAPAILALLSCGPASALPQIERISSEQARANLQKGQIYLLDVRTEEEHRERSIPGTSGLVPVQGLSKALADKQLDHLKPKTAPWSIAEPGIAACRLRVCSRSMDSPR